MSTTLRERIEKGQEVLEKIHANGSCAVFWVGQDAFSLHGDYIGEMYGEDRIGNRLGVAKPSYVGRVGAV